jgi:hypothetical protein
MILQKELTEETLENARAWFESLGFSVDISFSTLYLELDCCSVELSQSEIECRAELWINSLNRKD